MSTCLLSYWSEFEPHFTREYSQDRLWSTHIDFSTAPCYIYQRYTSPKWHFTPYSTGKDRRSKGQCSTGRGRLRPRLSPPNTSRSAESSPALALPNPLRSSLLVQVFGRWANIMESSIVRNWALVAVWGLSLITGGSQKQGFFYFISLIRSIHRKIAQLG